MKHHTIIGGGGTKLHAVETGNPQGQTMLFIPGFSQCWLAWSRQLNSDLANDFRLVAVDPRGHGLSDKPKDAYGDSQLWADDINGVIQTLRLEKPILSGWSYGPIIILDYMRHYGESEISAIQFVGGISKLGSDEALAVLAPEFLTNVPGFFSSDVEESSKALSTLLRMCLTDETTTEEFYLMLGYNLSVPPHVRQALFSRTLNNEDLLKSIRKPVLITHAKDDAIVKPSVVDQHKSVVAHAEVQLMETGGHAPFWNDAQNFNDRLRSFAKNVSGLSASGRSR